MRHSIRFLLALAPTLAAAQQTTTTPVAAILPHLGPVEKSVYFEVADTSEVGTALNDVRVFANQVADALETLDSADEETLAIVRRAPDALHELGVFSVAGFGRSVEDEGDGVRLHRSFWAGGGARAWDLLATEAPAPVDCLPADSALAIASSADPRAVWDVARSVCDVLSPEALETFDKGVKSLRADSGVDAKALVGSMRPGLFAALTLDPNRTFEIDGCAGPLPSPGLVLGFRCETHDWVPTMAALAMGAGLPVQFEQRGPDGSEGFVIDLPAEATKDLPFELVPTVRWSPAKKMLVLASTQELACNALEDVAAPKLVDSPAFKERAAGLPADASVRWMSPELCRTIARLAELADDLPDVAKECFADTGDVWYVGRSRRTGYPGGLESVSRSTFSSPAAARLATELYQGSGLLAGGILGCLMAAGVESAMTGANSTKIANDGRNLLIAIMVANCDREAWALPPLWPKTNGKLFNETFSDANGYLSILLDKELISDVTEAEIRPFAGGTLSWCCLAGIEGESAYMPFLWSPNLKLDAEDFRRSVDLDNPVDWSGKVRDCPPLGRDVVVIVRKGGAVQTVRRELLSDVVFFGGESPANPENLRILEPGP